MTQFEISYGRGAVHANCPIENLFTHKGWIIGDSKIRTLRSPHQNVSILILRSLPSAGRNPCRGHSIDFRFSIDFGFVAICSSLDSHVRWGKGASEIGGPPIKITPALSHEEIRDVKKSKSESQIKITIATILRIRQTSRR